MSLPPEISVAPLTAVADESGAAASDSRFALPWQRAEAFGVAALTVALYARAGGSWRLFGALWLLPDLSILGYLAGARWGARSYNAVHTYLAPSVLTLAGLLIHQAELLPVALIWCNHIGVDRLLGYGLKSTAGFAFTHLGRLGKKTRSTKQPLISNR